ncbi:hypothetical protein BCY84_04407 [Trypanosoma cruzi cruzi]|nr:hypothetical protein BCY84_04407 [Trypanosoma cruzi cruzi]
MKGACNACLCRALLRVPEIGAERFHPAAARAEASLLLLNGRCEIRRLCGVICASSGCDGGKRIK